MRGYKFNHCCAADGRVNPALPATAMVEFMCGLIRKCEKIRSVKSQSQNICIANFSLDNHGNFDDPYSGVQQNIQHRMGEREVFLNCTYSRGESSRGVGGAPQRPAAAEGVVHKPYACCKHKRCAQAPPCAIKQYLLSPLTRICSDDDTASALW